MLSQKGFFCAQKGIQRNRSKVGWLRAKSGIPPLSPGLSAPRKNGKSSYLFDLMSFLLNLGTSLSCRKAKIQGTTSACPKASIFFYVERLVTVYLFLELVFGLLFAYEE